MGQMACFSPNDKSPSTRPRRLPGRSVTPIRLPPAAACCARVLGTMAAIYCFNKTGVIQIND